MAFDRHGELPAKVIRVLYEKKREEQEESAKLERERCWAGEGKWERTCRPVFMP